jgi:hypothetical protein
MEFLGDFFLMVYDIYIHQLNLKKFRNLKFLDKIPLMFIFFAFV